jgi:hypothetical protein
MDEKHIDVVEGAVDIERIQYAYSHGVPLVLTTFTMPHEFEVQLGQVIASFLSLAGREELKDYVIYCVQELAGNAKKANTKRVYFLEKKLDITNDEDYQKGMEQWLTGTTYGSYRKSGELSKNRIKPKLRTAINRGFRAFFQRKKNAKT